MEEIGKSRIEEIKKLHNEIFCHVRMSLENAIRIGQLLTEQKEELEHGEFIRWIKENLPFTDRAARRYMGLWSERDTIKSENVSDLTSAYRLLIEHRGPKEHLPSVPFRGVGAFGKETEYRDNVKKAIFVSDEKFNQLAADVTIKKGESKFLKGVDWMILGGKEPPDIINFPNSKLFLRQRQNDWQRVGEQSDRVEEKSEVQRDRTDQSGNSSSKEPSMIVNPKEFLSALKHCQKFVPEQEFCPLHLKYFWFHGNTLNATNSERGIAYKFEGLDFGDSIVHPDSLIVSFLKLKDDTRLQLEPKDIKITSGNYESRIPLFEKNCVCCEKDFQFPETPTDVHDLPKHFLDPVREVYFAAMHDSTSFGKISAVFVDKNAFYSTNNLVIAKYTSDLDINVSFAMPDELLELVLSDKNSPFGYALDGKHFWLCYNSYSAYAKLIKNPLPISSLKEAFDSIPKSETFCEFDKSAMAQALKRVEPFTEGTSRKMHVKVTKNKITLECKIDEFGECSEVVDCEGGGDWSFTVGHRGFEKCTSRIPKFQCYPRFRKERDVLYFKNENLECLLLSLTNEN